MKTLVYLHFLACLAFDCNGRRLLKLSGSEQTVEVLNEHTLQNTYDHNASQELEIAASQHALPALQKSQSRVSSKYHTLSRGISILFQALTQAAAFKSPDKRHESKLGDSAEDGVQNATVDENLTEIKKVMADLKFQKWAKYLTKQMNARVDEQIQSMMEDPLLKEQAERLTEYMNARRSEPDYEEQSLFQMAKRFVEAQQTRDNGQIGMLMAAEYFKHKTHFDLNAVMEEVKLQEQECKANPVMEDALDAKTTSHSAGFQEQEETEETEENEDNDENEENEEDEANVTSILEDIDDATTPGDFTGRHKRSLSIVQHLKNICGKVPDEAKRAAILLLVGSVILRLVGSSIYYSIRLAGKHADQFLEKQRKKRKPVPLLTYLEKVEEEVLGEWNKDGWNVWAIRKPRRRPW